MNVGEWLRRSLDGAYCQECGRKFSDIPDAELRVHWLGECTIMRSKVDHGTK